MDWMTPMTTAPLAVTAGLALALGSILVAAPDSPAAPDADALKKMIARFAPVEIGADVSALPAAERQALTRLVQASRIMDALFLRQVWAGNEALLLDLLEDETPLGRARLRYFLINKGPWSRLDHDEPFIPGVPAKPGSANFLPRGRHERRGGALARRPSARGAGEGHGFLTTIRRPPPGGRQPFTAVPYSLEYQGELARPPTCARNLPASREPDL